MTLGEVFRKIDELGIKQCRYRYYKRKVGSGADDFSDVEACCVYGALNIGLKLGWYSDKSWHRLNKELNDYTKERFDMTPSADNDVGLLKFKELRQLP